MCGPSITIPTKSFSNTKHCWYHRLVTIQNEGGSWPSAGRVDKNLWCWEGTNFLSRIVYWDWVGCPLSPWGLGKGDTGQYRPQPGEGHQNTGRESEMQAQENNIGGTSWRHLTHSLWQSVSLGSCSLGESGYSSTGVGSREETIPGYMVFSLVWSTSLYQTTHIVLPFIYKFWILLSIIFSIHLADPIFFLIDLDSELSDPSLFT